MVHRYLNCVANHADKEDQSCSYKSRCNLEDHAQEVITVLSWRGEMLLRHDADRVGRYLPVNIQKHMFLNSGKKRFAPRSSKHDDILLLYADKLHARINGEKNIFEAPNVFLNAACSL